MGTDVRTMEAGKNNNVPKLSRQEFGLGTFHLLSTAKKTKDTIWLVRLASSVGSSTVGVGRRDRDVALPQMFHGEAFGSSPSVLSTKEKASKFPGKFQNFGWGKNTEPSPFVVSSRSILLVRRYFHRAGKTIEVFCGGSNFLTYTIGHTRHCLPD